MYASIHAMIYFYISSIFRTNISPEFSMFLQAAPGSWPPWPPRRWPARPRARSPGPGRGVSRAPGTAGLRDP